MLRSLTRTPMASTVQKQAVRSFMTSVAVADRPRSKALGAVRTGGGSKDSLDISNLDDFQFDDSTTVGYDTMEAQREVRKYLRITKYELPKLKDFVKPFQPPTKTQILRFRTSTYLGEANHPAAPKVVLTVPTKSLPLTNPELHKFLLLVGPRYDPVKEAKKDPEQFKDVELDLRHAAKSMKPKVRFPKEWNRPVNKAAEASA
ncbi:37S ribosomal protein S24, mitochondrial [Podila minutissima]|nr:37S ribosomal protein S24, mitochondrial [Podila minutissima]